MYFVSTKQRTFVFTPSKLIERFTRAFVDALPVSYSNKIGMNGAQRMNPLSAEYENNVLTMCRQFAC